MGLTKQRNEDQFLTGAVTGKLKEGLISQCSVIQVMNSGKTSIIKTNTLIFLANIQTCRVVK